VFFSLFLSQRVFKKKEREKERKRRDLKFVKIGEILFFLASTKNSFLPKEAIFGP